jgi:hypothetical protein
MCCVLICSGIQVDCGSYDGESASQGPRPDPPELIAMVGDDKTMKLRKFGADGDTVVEVLAPQWYLGKTYKRKKP